ncbi:MAG: MopE-related protein [Polyangiales bacterium]
MRRAIVRLQRALTSMLLLCWLAAPAAAQSTAVRPYFLVIVDTSGSMSDAIPSGMPAPSCPGYANTKMGSAKCALTKIVQATGDADFGLMQYSKASNNTDCSNVGTCDPVPDAGWLRVPVETNSWQQILPLVDNNGAGPADELCAGGNTPIGGVLLAARQYWQTGFGGFQPPTMGDTGLSCRPLSVILLTDGDECCGDCANIIAANPAWQGCPKANLATGITCATGCSSVTTCGNNNFSESAPEFAYEMLTESMVPSATGTVAKKISTYAIGFGISPGDQHIEHIAVAGGTTHGYYASNEAQLSAALNQIIADAQPPAEICNNLDDDCDMLIDEGIPKFCDLPHGITDKTLCVKPPETVCDGKDDNCDGLIDEGVLNACGSCGPVPDEVCDGLDNDCDGHIDEDVPMGGACGTDKGSCMPGTLMCISGSDQCAGEVGPKPETCNCKDDDCDGTVDEEVPDSLCPDGKCIGCVCVPHCVMTAEFMPSCSKGLRPEIEQPSGECFCVTDNCDAPSCEASTLTRDDELACAPSDPSVATCLCRAGMCVARCDGVACPDGQICSKRNGRCVKNDCTGLGCGAGELCDPVSGKCGKDACADAKCKSTEVCREGKCERSCATLLCADGQRCDAGRCVTDQCATTKCKSDDVCNPSDGKCVADVCPGMTCGDGLACSVSTGMCERDPCWDVRCSAGEACAVGQCAATAGNTSKRAYAGSDPNARVLAAGGGGCSCRVAAGSPDRGRAGALALLGLGLALRLRRRRRSPSGTQTRTALVASIALVAASLLLGCRVTPFCVDCTDSGTHKSSSDSGIPGARDASSAQDGGTAPGTDGGDAGSDGSTQQQTCMDPQPETCNGKDDDCDYKVDEDVVPDVNNCEQAGLCAGTTPTCIAGQFTCRYPDARETEETKCDGIDSDCDGRVDETFKTLGDACTEGVGACQVTGKLVCNKGGNGVSCKIAHTIDPSDEICDGIDNDCDGLVDEPKSAPGSAPSYVVDDVVQAGPNLWIDTYEASHPDASSSDQGVIGTRACSRASVLPWTSATYPEALAACMAADMQLCELADWVSACEGTSTCLLSYTPSSGSCLTDLASYPTDGSACNGHDLAAAPGAADDDALAPTGSHAQCFTTTTGGKVFDMSGNAKEWTVGPSSPSQNPLRGGSYNNVPGGMTCTFDFAVASDQVRLPNVGFRCCSHTAP